MRKNILFFRVIAIAFILLFGSGFVMGQIIISQYIETNTGLYPKGIEVCNFSGSAIDFSVTNLTIFKGVNGATPALDFTVNTGTLEHGDVIVIGTLQDVTQAGIGFKDFVEANGAVFYNKQFTFNGDDALVLYLDGVVADVFGNPGSDPGTGWVGNGVQTYDQNISIKSAITTGDTDGWTDTSERFEVTTTDNSLTGFGIAPNKTTWTGVVSDDWATSGNWNNGLPNADHNVTIPTGLTNYPTISSSANCNNILIEDGASLIGAEYLTVGGTATMQRSISPYTTQADGWHLLSSPVNSMAIAASDFVPGVTDDFYAWGESTYTWLNYKVPANTITNFINGQGYLVAYETSTGPKDFVGAFNSTDIPINNLAKTTAGNGWHLLGNPYQSALQWTNTDWARTNISAGAKIMNSGGSYTDISVGLTDIIPANQGFFVQASVDASNSITMPLSQRVHGSAAFYKSEPANVLSLKASDGDYYVETWIQIMDDATLGFDAAYDMNFLGGMQNAPYLYSAISETENLSTNRIAPVDQLIEVPLAFKSFLDKEFTISTNNANSFESDIDVYLKDKVANISVNLKETPEYTFTATAGELTDRFVVQLFKSSTSIPNIDFEDVQIFSNGEQVFLRSEKNSTAVLSVFNMLGQEVYFKTIVLGGIQTIDLNQKAGWYVVQLMGEQGVVREKVFIQ